jgi:hypothetical protein
MPQEETNQPTKCKGDKMYEILSLSFQALARNLLLFELFALRVKDLSRWSR